jgi:hypothetical protein
MELTSLLADNMARLPASLANTASIIEELFAKGDTGFDTIEEYADSRANAFTAAALASVDTGVEVPTVSDDCDQETKDAATSLTMFLNDLGNALAYQQFNQDELDLCCDDIVTTITDLTEQIRVSTDEECGPENVATLQDLFVLA